MKKNLLFTLMLVFVLNLVISSPVYQPTKQPFPLSEVKGFVQSSNNPSDVHDLALKMISFLKSKNNDLKTDQMLNSTMTEVIHKNWDGLQWLNNTKDQYMYDDNGFEYESYIYIWNPETEHWDYTFWTINTNNSVGLPVYQLLKMWDGSVWSDFISLTYTYTSFWQPQEIVGSFYLGAWMDITKTIYSYNNLEQCTEIVNQEFDFVSTWNNTTKDSFTYNTSGWLTENLSQKWESDAWVNDSIANPTYDAEGHETERLQKAWVSNDWENAVHSTYTYNAQWLKIQDQREIWINNIWENSELFTNQYDAQDRISEVLYKVWGGSSWSNQTLSSWTYGLPVSIQLVPISSQTFSVYPNPAKDKITVEINKLSNNELISVYNGQGQIVIQKAVQQLKTEIDISNLAKGGYFIMVENNEGLNQKIFIKK